MKDPIVEEVREARRKHAERFNFDLDAICEDLKKIEQRLRASGYTFADQAADKKPAVQNEPPK